VRVTPFVKTTGGKGLHVVAAIKGTPKNPATWEGAKDFARGLAERLAAVSPVRFTTSASKAARAGKIFIDYLRNARMATAVAPWSLRARLGAPIALPLAWRDVRKGLNPADFTVGNVAALIKCSDPWKGLAASAASLEAARQALLSARL
jgi:bifunctional non-homologous end joining protein LigD